MINVVQTKDVNKHLDEGNWWPTETLSFDEMTDQYSRIRMKT